MQLFQHAYGVLRDCAAAANADSHPDDMISAESRLMLQPMAGLEDQPGNVTLKVSRARGKPAPDWHKASAAAQDFCGSVLQYAFNPLVKGQPRFAEDAAPVEVEEGDAPHAICLTAPARLLRGSALQEASDEIAHIEQRMFKAWQRTVHPTILEKRFASEEECERMQHLLICMAEAFGIDEKKIERSFHEVDDARTLRLDSAFLKMLVEREQSTEASVKKRRTGGIE